MAIYFPPRWAREQRAEFGRKVAHHYKCRWVVLVTRTCEDGLQHHVGRGASLSAALNALITDLAWWASFERRP